LDWRNIHADLDRRLVQLGSTYATDPSRVQALLRERSARLATAPADRRARQSQSRLLVFRTSGERYGLLLENAREICRISRMALLPGSSTAVLGIINWRGEFVTVFDSARLLGLSPGEGNANPYAIVLRDNEPLLALAVGALEGIVRLDLAELQTAGRPGTKHHDLFKGITGDAVLVLEHGRLLGRLKEELHAA
jgi:chemotaxis signal transduction protein